MSDTASPVLETADTTIKTAALGLPDKTDVEGFSVFPFSAMRKAFLEMTGNELLNSEAHIKKYQADNNLGEISGEMTFDVMEKAVPQFTFHMTALAFICTSTAADLSKLIGKPREAFHEAVTVWWGNLKDEQWQKLTVRAFQELVESNIGNDYKPKEEPGNKPTPN